MKYFLMLFALVTFSSFGQKEKCEYQFNGVDEFTKEKTLVTKFEVLSYGMGQNQVVRVQGVKKDNQRYLRCYFVLTDVFSIDENSKLMLLDENQEVTTLQFSQFATADYNTGIATSWYIAYDFPLTDDLFEELKTKTFTKLRFYPVQKVMQHDIKKKFQSHLKEVLICIE